ncbi:unnamed protein product [Echinostoma caproni]|uniref:Uncharacterized protein n=1 Tax=Echinostoma caproni TaxID=27848 RepID=A0A183A6L0_9TREM|nr:unnamed protein product [Echinostoma caproni]
MRFTAPLKKLTDLAAIRTDFNQRAIENGDFELEDPERWQKNCPETQRKLSLREPLCALKSVYPDKAHSGTTDNCSVQTHIEMGDQKVSCLSDTCAAVYTAELQSTDSLETSNTAEEIAGGNEPQVDSAANRTFSIGNMTDKQRFAKSLNKITSKLIMETKRHVGGRTGDPEEAKLLARWRS